MQQGIYRMPQNKEQNSYIITKNHLIRYKRTLFTKNAGTTEMDPL